MEAEACAHEVFDRKGRRFLGAKAVKARSPFDRPMTKEPRRTLRPQVACRDKSSRIAWLAEIKVFFEEYREALREFASGVRETIFPAGTYMMRVRFAVACHDPPA
jgi:putative transposase